jgi:hypothetical protein
MWPKYVNSVVKKDVWNHFNNDLMMSDQFHVHNKEFFKCSFPMDLSIRNMHMKVLISTTHFLLCSNYQWNSHKLQIWNNDNLELTTNDLESFIIPFHKLSIFFGWFWFQTYMTFVEIFIVGCIQTCTFESRSRQWSRWYMC